MDRAQRVLVVDDDARIAASVRRALVYEGYTVDVVHDGEAALASARNNVPDLVVLDVMLPGVDGLEVCRRLRQADDVPILLLTARDATADRVRGLDTGADDYLVKPFAYEELLARVRALLRRRSTAETQTTLRWEDMTMDLGAHEVTRGSRAVDLTALEFKLLEQLLRHPRLVLSRQQLLEAVWDAPGVESNVVDVYVGYLRQKLGEPRIIQTVRGVGYVLKPG
ncbi:MAG TPA: response regulator transcription factor [Chloroflexota bacterium]|jgi:two-component system response regulator MprA